MGTPIGSLQRSYRLCASRPGRELEILPLRDAADSLPLFDAQSHMKLESAALGQRSGWRNRLLNNIVQCTILLDVRHACLPSTLSILRAYALGEVIVDG